MRTFLGPLLLLALAGFLLNAIVLLILAGIGSELDHTRFGMRPVGGVHWSISVTPSVSGDVVGWTERSVAKQGAGGMAGPNPQELLPSWLSEPAPTDADFGDALERQRMFLAVGLPFRTAWCDAYTLTVNPDGTRNTPVARGGIRLPYGQLHTSYVGMQPATLPLRPIWLGLALNTLFYTCVLGVVAWLIHSLRALRRFRRGVCPRCRYALHGNYSHGCSECGWQPIPGSTPANDRSS